jgi:hypothetical protein
MTPQLCLNSCLNFTLTSDIVMAILGKLRQKLGQSWGTKKGSWVQLTNPKFMPQLQLQFDKNCPNWAPSWGWSWGRSWRYCTNLISLPGHVMCDIKDEVTNPLNLVVILCKNRKSSKANKVMQKLCKSCVKVKWKLTLTKLD